MNASLLLIYAAPFSLDSSSMHQVSIEITTSWQMFTLLLYHLVHHKELQESFRPWWILEAHSRAPVKHQTEDLLCVCARVCSPHLWKVCFFSPQSQGFWAAPLMMVFAAGSGTKMETCTGRRRLIRQVVKVWEEEEERAVLLSSHAQIRENVCMEMSKAALLSRHAHTCKTHARSDNLSSFVLFCSITGQDKNDLREVVCLLCRSALCSAKWCKWDVDYSTCH